MLYTKLAKLREDLVYTQFDEVKPTKHGNDNKGEEHVLKLQLKSFIREILENNNIMNRITENYKVYQAS